MRRLVFGGLAGIAATVAMTAAMRRFHSLLDENRQYPLPPREIIDRMGLDHDERTARDRTVLAHFGYGALTGALFAVLPRLRGGGAAFGLGIWAVSYFGWIPALRILSPANRHPRQRNLLMTAAHVVWGVVLAKSLNELERSGNDVFARMPGQDRTHEIEMIGHEK